MSATCFDVLAKAIDGRLEAAIAARLDEKACQLQVQLQGEEAGEGFYAKVLSGSSDLIDRLISAQSIVEVSFSANDAKVFLDSVILRKKRNYWLNKAILLRMPENVSVVDQRNKAREWVPEHIPVTTRAFKVEADRKIEVPARLWDISLGGASFICPADRNIALLECDDPMLIAIRVEEAELHVPAIHRYTQPLSSSSARIGVEFKLDGPGSEQDVADLKHLIESLEQLRIQRVFRTALKRRDIPRVV
jgi:c-di-GMP-binding flagellar brake protein YcgR